MGPVVIIDTPGLDDDADVLGTLRIQKAYQMLNKTDIAILVIDGTVGMTEEDKKILTHIQDKKIPYIVVLNKADLAVSNVCPGNLSDSIVESCQIPSEHNFVGQCTEPQQYPGTEGINRKAHSFF